MPGVRVRWGRWPLCAAVLAAVSAAFLGMGAASAKPKPRSFRHCPRAATRVRINHRRTCFARPRLHRGDPGLQASSASAALASTAKLRYRHVRAKKRHAADAARRAVLSATGRRALHAALELGLRALAPSAFSARRAKAAEGGSGSVDQDGPAMGGWNTHVSGTVTAPTGDRNGATTDVTATATKDVAGVGSLKQTVRKKEGYTVAKCPDPNGVVPGTSLDEETFGFDGKLDGKGSASVTVRFRAEGTEEAHIGDDGHLVDYDHSIVFTTLIQVEEYDAEGHNITSQAPELYTIRMAKRHIHPPLKLKDVDGLTFDAVMPGSPLYVRGSDRYKRAVKVTQIAGFDFWWLAFRIEQELATAESHWQDGGCATVKATAAKTQLKRGESTTISVKVSSPAGDRLVPGKVTASVDTGTISPTSASYGPDGNVTLTYTASSPRWGGDSFAAIQIKTSSRQGSDRAYLRLTPVPNDYVLRLTSDVGETFTPATTVHGTGSAHYAVSGSAAVHAGIGSGTLGWNGFSYTDKGIVEYCQDGRLMSADFTGGGTVPGTMNVRSLDLASGDPKLELEIVDPTEHLHAEFHQEGSGCKSFSADYDFHDWAELLERAAFDGPSGVAWRGEGATYAQLYTFTGWQRSGGGFVKDLRYTPQGLGAGATGVPSHVRLELSPAP